MRHQRRGGSNRIIGLSFASCGPVPVASAVVCSLNQLSASVGARFAPAVRAVNNAPTTIYFARQSAQVFASSAFRSNVGMSKFTTFAASFVAALALELHGGKTNGSHVAVLYLNGTSEMDGAFGRVIDHFAKSFDYNAYGEMAKQFDAGLQIYTKSALFKQYAHGSVVPHCDVGVAPQSVSSVRGVAAFPGGVVGSVFGLDFGKRLYELSTHARGPVSAGLVAPMALSEEALANGMGLVQAGLAAMVHVVPPLIAPPAWNNQPLSCAPMVAGHNCFGSVLYPIAMADVMVADVTDSMLDGYIAGFPGLYAKKVGKTSDSMYKACFSAYMGMMCSSVFPRCTTPQSRSEIIAVGGSAPVCLHMCLLPLVMCPGFWVNDLLDGCSTASVPPLCSQAPYSKVDRAPPQYASFDEAHPFSPTCPPSVGGTNRDIALYDIEAFPASPIEQAAAAFAPSPATS